jgi:hypothetical protein
LSITNHLDRLKGDTDWAGNTWRVKFSALNSYRKSGEQEKRVASLKFHGYIIVVALLSVVSQVFALQ